ncbi:hypothetical protein Tco_1158962, partial [Tanacetum coccineum]
VKPIVNRVKPANVFHKTPSPSSRPFKKATVLRTKFSNQKLNTAKVKAVSTVGGKGKLLLSPQQVVIGDHKDTIVDPVLENARIEADRILAEKLQEQEREQFTIEERTKFLHDTIAAQRKFLARQRSEAIRNRP